MFGIGPFATLGRVSVRMLRHYDRIGLLRPARVDPHTSYRYYEAAQLRRLNRLIALKELGLGLAQVRAILDEEVDGTDLRGVLREQEQALSRQIEADRDQLQRVRARLRLIDAEQAAQGTPVTLERVDPVRVAFLDGAAASADSADVSPVVRVLFGRLVHGPAWRGSPVHRSPPTGPSTRAGRRSAPASRSARSGTGSTIRRSGSPSWPPSRSSPLTCIWADERDRCRLPGAGRLDRGHRPAHRRQRPRGLPGRAAGARGTVADRDPDAGELITGDRRPGLGCRRGASG